MQRTAMHLSRIGTDASKDAGHACPVRLGVASVTGGADERGGSKMSRIRVETL